ncbi:MAG: 4-hydroxy-tetrahydrodipicolinate synthase [Planctomycetota bacterium]
MDKKIEGVYAVICTPFTEDDQIDKTTLRKHLRYLVDQGNVHGIIPTGSTGEFAAMSEQELRQIADITIDEVKGKVPVVVGTAAVSTSDTIKRSQYAQKAGADGVMVVPPYYCHPNEREIYEHYKALAESIELPIVLYNNPGTSGVDMLPPLVARLAEFEQISHIKESSGDMTRVAEIMRLCGDKIDIFCGCDTLSMEMFLVGAKGWVAPPANMIPNLCVQLYQLAAVHKDIQQARELYFKLLPLFTMFETAGQYVQLTKAGLEILGRPYGKPRRPLLSPTGEDKQRLREILQTLMT